MTTLPIPSLDQPHCQNMISHSTEAEVREAHARNLIYCGASALDIQLTNLREAAWWEQAKGFHSHFTLTWNNWQGYRVYMLHCGCLVGEQNQWLEKNLSTADIPDQI